MTRASASPPASIHVGSLMDRVGTRCVTLFFVWTVMVLAPVFPLVPWFWSLRLFPAAEVSRRVPTVLRAAARAMAAGG